MVGWRGLVTAGFALPTAYFGYAAASRVPKHELIGMSYLGASEEELYAKLTHKQNNGILGQSFGSMMEQNDTFETAATVGTAFHDYMETLKSVKGETKETEKYIYSKKYGLAGYADVVYEDSIADIKSVTPQVFEQVKNLGRPLKKSYDQVNTYAILSGQRKARIEYHLQSDPSKKITYEWEASKEAFNETMAKVNRVRSRISAEISAGVLKREELPTKLNITSQRIADFFVGAKYSTNPEGVAESLNAFIEKRDTYSKDRRNSTITQLRNVNINDMMDGNKSEYLFKAAQNGGRRHQYM